MPDNATMEIDVRRSVGLRTEIIVNLILLLGAALLFAGFLILRFHERELLVQRLESLTSSLEIVADALVHDDAESYGSVRASLLALSLMRSLSAGVPLRSWTFADAALIPLAEMEGGQMADEDSFRRVKMMRESDLRPDYSSGFFTAGGESPSFLVTVPLLQRGEFIGALQARFSLEDIRDKVAAGRRLVLLYAVLYGTILTIFGLWLLNRTIIVPVRRLREGTRRVTDGDLATRLPVEGPNEIAELAASFNTMAASLGESRVATESHIESLRRTNETLEKTRDELVRSERMASVGHLAAGMAHEIGNPLGALIGYLEFAGSSVSNDVEKDVLGRSLAEAMRIDRLVKDLLDYAAPDREGIVAVRGDQLLSEAAELLCGQGALDGVAVEMDFSPDLPSVPVMRHRLFQVFVNLLLNARDASAVGGTIRLSARDQGEDVLFEVADTGEGMDEETIAHVFDPFFTTKPQGKGRGLGLFICHRIIDEMGGRIGVVSKKGGGSVFAVRLPKSGRKSCRRK